MRHQLAKCGLLCSVFYLVLVLMSPVCTIIWNKSKLAVAKKRKISLLGVRSEMAK